MPDAFDQNASDVGLSLDLIEEEIEAGMPAHADRLCLAFDNEEFYAGRNLAYIPRRESEDWQDYVKRPKRTSKLTRKVIRTLSADLYSPGPTRKLAGEAGTWLDALYQANHVNSLMQQADARATLNGVSAIQALGTGRPEKPVRLYLWGAHEFVAYTWPDDPGEAWAVVTIARERRTVARVQEHRVRYEAWSRDEHRVYHSKWKNVPLADSYTLMQYRSLFGVTARFMPDLSGEPAGSGKNPYGVLPFSFVHDSPPISDFNEGGIGNILRECNAEIDRELSDLAQHAKEFMNPDRFTRGVSPGWRREKRAGNWQQLTPDMARNEDAGTQPEAFLVQANLAIEQVWFDITTYANTTLEDVDVPVTAVRADASTDLSGIAIVAKHLPLLQRTKARQPHFTRAECELKEMVLTLAGNFYDQPALLAAVDTDLSVIWPAPKFPLPTPERDAEDQADIEAGRKSVIQVTAEREGMTSDQAKAHLELVIEENQWYADLLKSKGLTTPDPIAAVQPAPADPNQADPNQAPEDGNAP